MTIWVRQDDRTAETICVRMTDMAYTCETCPADTAVSQCVTLKAELFKAAGVDLALTPVDGFDTSCYADKRCL